MDFKIEYGQNFPAGSMTWDKNLDISTDIFNSLNIKQGSFFQNLSWGSQLYKIKKVVPSNLLIIEQYVKEALSWMLLTGYTTDIQVTASLSNYSAYRYDISMSLTQANGLTLSYQYYQDVRSGKVVYVPVI